MKTRIMLIVASILIAAVLMFMCSCAQKSSNEISEMTKECFSKRQGIVIKFLPQKESTEEMQEKN